MSFIFLRNRVTGGAAFSPASLFASGEEGAWYEPSTATCFTDTAGTTAASVGDAVARINDLSGNGNHATQITSAERPLLQQTAGGLYYLAFDGANDGMATASIDFTTTDKMSVFAGVENEKDIATRGEFVAHNRTGNGITCAMPANNGSADFSITSKGTTLREAGVPNNAIYDQPFLCALTATMDISGDSIILRVNGAQIASNAGDQGTGNYANAPLLVGNGGGLPFTGKIFSLIVRGAASTAQEISDTESYVANLTGVTL